MLKQKTVLLAALFIFTFNPLSILSGIFTPGPATGFQQRVMAQTAQALTFTQVADNLDLRKHTKYHVKEYIRMNRGMEVKSSGKVVDVVGGRGKVRILVANSARRTIKGFNIVLTMYYDLDKASTLRKDQFIRFKGYLHKYKAGRNGGIIIYLREAQLL